jgi:hypothetical protein
MRPGEIPLIGVVSIEPAADPMESPGFTDDTAGTTVDAVEPPAGDKPKRAARPRRKRPAAATAESKPEDEGDSTVSPPAARKRPRPRPRKKAE